MLEIAVHNHAAVSRGGLKTGEDRSLLAEIAGKGDAFYLGIVVGQLMDVRISQIPGTVVHKQDFKGDLLPVKNLFYRMKGFGDHILLVVGGNDYGK